MIRQRREANRKIPADSTGRATVGAVGLNVPLDAPDEGIAHLYGDKNVRAVHILLGHTNIENTVRYLGVNIDDAITLAERTEI